MVQELERAAADGRVVSMHELSILTTTEVICKVRKGVLQTSVGLVGVLTGWDVYQHHTPQVRL